MTSRSLLKMFFFKMTKSVTGKKPKNETLSEAPAVFSSATWKEGDDGRVRVGPFVEVHHDLGRALPAVAAHCGLVADVPAAVHDR